MAKIIDITKYLKEGTAQKVKGRKPEIPKTFYIRVDVLEEDGDFEYDIVPADKLTTTRYGKRILVDVLISMVLDMCDTDPEMTAGLIELLEEYAEDGEEDE